MLREPKFTRTMLNLKLVLCICTYWAGLVQYQWIVKVTYIFVQEFRVSLANLLFALNPNGIIALQAYLIHL